MTWTVVFHGEMGDGVDVDGEVLGVAPQVLSVPRVDTSN